MRKQKVQHIVISVLFVIIIGITFLNNMFHVFSGNMDAKENRIMAEEPKIDISNLDAFPKKYEAFYNDNFLFRADYISFMLFLSQKIFKKSNVKGNYMIGLDNWIFQMRKNFSWFIGGESLNQSQLEKYKIEFSKREEYFNSIGAKMYLLVIPSKYSIYNDKLPYFLRAERRTWTDQFIDYLKENTTVNIIDGRKSVKKGSKAHKVFFKHDTHWNDLGAYFAISDLIDKVRVDFPEIPKFSLEDFEMDTVKKYDGNLKSALANSDSLYEINYNLILKKSNIQKGCSGYNHIENDDFSFKKHNYCFRVCNKLPSNQLKVVLFRDSFMNFSCTALVGCKTIL